MGYWHLRRDHSGTGFRQTGMSEYFLYFFWGRELVSSEMLSWHSPCGAGWLLYSCTVGKVCQQTWYLQWGGSSDTHLSAVGRWAPSLSPLGLCGDSDCIFLPPFLFIATPCETLLNSRTFLTNLLLALAKKRLCISAKGERWNPGRPALTDSRAFLLASFEQALGKHLLGTNFWLPTYLFGDLLFIPLYSSFNQTAAFFPQSSTKGHQDFVALLVSRLTIISIPVVGPTVMK